MCFFESHLIFLDCSFKEVSCYFPRPLLPRAALPSIYGGILLPTFLLSVCTFNLSLPFEFVAALLSYKTIKLMICFEYTVLLISFIQLCLCLKNVLPILPPFQRKEP